MRRSSVVVDGKKYPVPEPVAEELKRLRAAEAPAPVEEKEPEPVVEEEPKAKKAPAKKRTTRKKADG